MDITSTRGQKMLEYVPKYYETSRVIKSVFQADGNEFDLLRTALNDALNQFYVDTATWTLDDWEDELGLVPGNDETNDERRDRIKSRLRGYGTATIYLVKNVAEAYDKGSIDVIQDHPHYKVEIRFVDTTGVPTNLEDLKAAVRAVVPAHLEIFYTYNYLIWNELDNKGWTWDELDALNLTWDELEVYD